MLETAIRNKSKNSINVIENYFRNCNQLQLARRRLGTNQANNVSTNSTWLNKKTTVDSVLESSGTISDISLLNRNGNGDISSIITSTFNDESHFSQYLPELVEPSRRTTPFKQTAKVKSPPREIQNKTVVLSGNDEQDCLPMPVPRKSRKQTVVEPAPRTPVQELGAAKSHCKSRFQSPQNLPPFYSEVLKQKRTTETQTTSPCVIMKRKDLVKSKSSQPEQHQPQQQVC